MSFDQIVISGIASLLVALIVLFFKESTLELIRKFFSSLSTGQVKSIYLLIMIVLMAIPFLQPDIFSFASNEKSMEADSSVYESSITKEELIAKGIDLTEDLIARKRVKDSIRLANKPERWVYKIGISSGRKNLEFYKLFQTLKKQGNIYAFQASKKSYFLIKDDNLTYEQLMNNHEHFKASLPNTVNRVEIINLMNYCKIKESIIATDMLTWKKVDVDIPCLTCGK